MSLTNRNPATYQKYDEVINCVLKSLALVRTGGKFTPISYRDFDVKHSLKTMHLRVMRVDSIPTGTMAMEAMVMEVLSFKDDLVKNSKYFSIKFNQITNTVGFKMNKEYDRDFDQCCFVYQNDDMEEIKKHIDKVMYNLVVKEKLFSLTGEHVDFDEVTDRHYTLLNMIFI